MWHRNGTGHFGIFISAGHPATNERLSSLSLPHATLVRTPPARKSANIICLLMFCSFPSSCSTSFGRVRLRVGSRIRRNMFARCICLSPWFSTRPVLGSSGMPASVLSILGNTSIVRLSTQTAHATRRHKLAMRSQERFRPCLNYSPASANGGLGPFVGVCVSNPLMQI